MTEDRQAGHKPNPHKIPVEQGTNWLLTIGIDQYEHHKNLQKAVADAKGFAEIMTTRYGFKHLQPPLYDAEATERNIRRALGQCKTLGEHDRLIVFYAGHGWYESKTNLGYIVPTEAENDPNTDFIPTNFITNIFQGVDAKHILLIVDCCFGGSFGVERTMMDVEAVKKVNRQLDTKRSRMVLSSGGIERVSDGLVSANNSPFTSPLLAILADNQLPILVMSEIFPLLRKKANWETDHQMAQYKVLQGLKHGDGELGFYCTDLESAEERAYKAAIQAESVPIYEDFLYEDAFTNSQFKENITRCLKDKRAADAWQRIEKSDRIEDFLEFNLQFAYSSFVNLATNKIDQLKKRRIEKQKPVNKNDKQELKKYEESEVEIKSNKEDNVLTDLLKKGFTLTEALRKIQIDSYEAKKEQERHAKAKIEQEQLERDEYKKARKKMFIILMIVFFGALLISNILVFIYYSLFTFAFQGRSDLTYKFAFFTIIFAISMTLSMYYSDQKNIEKKFLIGALVILPLLLIVYTCYSYYTKPTTSFTSRLEISEIQRDSQKRIEIEIREGKKAYEAFDYVKAFSLLDKHRYNKAFDSEAQRDLGVIRCNGRGSIRNYTEALEWLQKSAEQGYAGGQFSLGVMYERSNGVKQDYAEAVKWYTKAAEQGNLDAQTSLGYMYDKGEHVKQDYKEAVKWYQKAAEQGYNYGQNNLGHMYENGKGVKKDLKEAVRLYRLAAKQGHKGAKDALKRLGESE